MNRLIIVGNGFDLAHGVKTSYKDFIEWYFGKVIERLQQRKTELENQKEEGAIVVYKDKLLNIYWGGSCDGAIKVIEEIINRVESDGNIVVIRNEYIILEKNLSPLLTRIIGNYENKGWVDIEADYYELLKDYALKGYGEVKQLNEELSYIEKKLIEYLTEVEKKLNEETINEEIKKIIYTPFITRELSSNGKKNFNEHKKYWQETTEGELKNQLYFLLGYEFEQIESMLNDVKKFKQGTSNSFPVAFELPNDIMLLNFNYTKIADRYSIVGAIHIHGKLDDEGSVIFGYGDELDEKYKEIENLNDNECLEKVKSVKYLERDNYRKVLSFIESEPFQVYIMGHSCGNSDRTLLNTIFEHKNCVSIKPFYYKKENGTDNYSEIVRNITRNFNDKQLLRDRVVNKTYCKPLPQSKIEQG